jgi:transcriptional regulator with XRE-family HTH domain
MINERIKQVRKNNNLTMEKFGERIGVKKNTVSQWESGVNNPTDQTIMLICKEFNVDENWLRTGEGEMSPSTDREKSITDAVNRLMGGESDSFKSRFINMLAGLTESEWEIIERKAIELARSAPASKPETIDTEVEDYRRQLEEEKKAGEESEASLKDA